MTEEPANDRHSPGARLWETDPGSLSPLRGALLQVQRVLYVAGRELSGEYLAVKARGLVYATLLSIVPLLAVTFSVLKGLGVHARYEIILYYVLEPLGEKGVNLSMQIIGFVENARAGVLGTVGLAFLFYAAASQLRKLEAALNSAWHVREASHFGKRLARYLSVILLGPAGVAVAAGFAASFADSAVYRELFASPFVASLVPLFGRITFALCVCGVFAFVYLVFPNTKVRAVPAFAGGVFAGSVWLAMGWVFAHFIATSARYSLIYSGFAALILFLIWLYWSFLILLVGGRVAFYIQFPGLHLVPVEGISLSPAIGERLALQTMFLIGRSFHEGLPPWTLETLAGRLRAPSEALADVLDVLGTAGLVESTGERHPGGYVPGRDIEVITIREIVEAARRGRSERYPFSRRPPRLDAVEQVIAGMRGALTDHLADGTLGEMIRAAGEQGPAAAPGGQTG